MAVAATLILVSGVNAWGILAQPVLLLCLATSAYVLACWNARSAMNGLVLRCGRAPAPREFDQSKLEITESVLDL